jgi:hypothetical protein
MACVEKEREAVSMGENSLKRDEFDAWKSGFFAG